jgi:hypothetical protein
VNAVAFCMIEAKEIQKYLNQRLSNRLMRYSVLQNGFKYEIPFEPSNPTWVKAILVENWCEENCRCDFWVCPEAALFNDSNDAMLFKLVYGGKK